VLTATAGPRRSVGVLPKPQLQWRQMPKEQGMAQCGRCKICTKFLVPISASSSKSDLPQHGENPSALKVQHRTTWDFCPHSIQRLPTSSLQPRLYMCGLDRSSRLALLHCIGCIEGISDSQCGGKPACGEKGLLKACQVQIDTRPVHVRLHGLHLEQQSPKAIYT